MSIGFTNQYRPKQALPEKIVVTGVGVVTSIGTGKEIFWRNLLAGKCGIRPVKAFSTEGFPVHCGAEIEDFAGDAYVHRLREAEIGRASQFAIASARLALEDAGLSITETGCRGSGVVIGTTSGEPNLIESVRRSVHRG